MAPKVCILILNWNNHPDTLRCLRSIRRLNYRNAEVVVIDNASTNNSVQIIRTAYPDIDVLVNQDNLGFAGGNNVGIKYALERGTDYIWLLNNDTEVHPEALEQMVKIAETDPVIGMVGSQIFHLGQRDKLLFAGGKINWPGGWCSHDTRHGLEKKLKDVDFITGCSLLVRRDVVERVGMLDESFFLYFEDTDWSIRTKKAGFKLVVALSSIVWHKETGSVGRRSPTHEYYVTRNNLLFMKKHAEPLLWVTFAPFFLLKITIKALLFSAKGQFNLLPPIVQAVEDFFVGRFGKQMVK